MNWNTRFAGATELMRRNTVREFLKHAKRPGMISFGGGLPAAELFPLREFERACEAVFRKHSGQALQYSESEGVGALREYIAGTLGVNVENVLITSGAQQALDLLGRVFINPGDRVAVENPTYLALLSSWRVHRPEFQPIASDENGLIVDEMDRMTAVVKLLYVVPNFQNPQGTTLSMERRVALAEFALRQEMIVVEDDPYGELCYEGEALPSLFELAGKSHSAVLRVGTFSKVLSPGLRVGWVAGDSAVIEKLVQAKQSADLHTGTFNQFVALELAQSGLLQTHVPNLRREYRARRDAMIAALENRLAEHAHWSNPTGGMFLLLNLGGLRGRDVASAALDAGVVVVPGEDFHVTDGAGTIRLNFSNCAPEIIREGVERLARVIATLRADRSPKFEKANYQVSFSPP